MNELLKLANTARLARCQRIVESAAYRTRDRYRISVHGRHFSIHITDNRLPHPRLGFVVSKKVSKLAVQRNRVKRQIREVFRQSQSQLCNMDFIVVAKPDISENTNAALNQDLVRLFESSQRKCQNQKRQNQS